MADRRPKDLVTTRSNPNSDDYLLLDGVTGGTAKMPANAALKRARALLVTIDGGGVAITTGIKGNAPVAYPCTITGWTLLADKSGSIVIDVWKDSYANYPPTVAGTIAGSEKPTLSAAVKNQDLTLTTWTTTLAAGDVLRINVDSAATVTLVHLAILVTETLA